MTAVLYPLARRIGEQRAFWVWIALATGAALALRLFRLDAAGFWVDELYSIATASDLNATHRSKALGYLPVWLGMWLSGVNPESLPPLSGSSVQFDSSSWRSLGVTHFAARLGPALVGALSVPILALASRRMLGTGPACVLAVLLALSPWHIYWSQAARFYSLQFLLYNLALIYYFTATQAGSTKRFAIAMGFMVLAFFSQPTALAILPVFAADWIIASLRGKSVRLGLHEWFIGAVAVGICCAVILSDYLAAPEQWQQFVSFAGTQYQPPHQLAMGMVYMTGLAVVVVALASAWGLRKSRPRLTTYLGLAALMPVALFTVWSLKNAVGLRYLFVALYGWLALAALGLDRVGALLGRKDPWLAWAPLAVLVGTGSTMLLGYYGPAKGFHPRWPEAYAYVQAHARPGDVITCGHPIVGKYYLQRPDVTFLPLNREELYNLGERVWLVVEQETTSGGDLEPWALELTEMKLSMELAIPRPISRVTVRLYERDRTDRQVSRPANDGAR
jgi:hypothetical protein